MVAELHDASLEEINLDWNTGRATIRLKTSAKEVLIIIGDVTEIVIPRKFPWGKSISVNKCHYSESNLTREMQSGDNIVIRGKLLV
jgi:hypothetical protein